MSEPYISWQSPIFDDNGAPSSFSASLMTLRLIERHLPAAQQMAPASGPEEWSTVVDAYWGSTDRDGSGALCVDKQSEVDC